MVQKNHVPAETGNKRLTQTERQQVIAAQPNMRGPKAAIDAAAWTQVEKIMKQRKLQQAK